MITGSSGLEGISGHHPIHPLPKRKAPCRAGALYFAVGYAWPRRSGRLGEAPAPTLHSGHGLWPSRRDGDHGLRVRHARGKKRRDTPGAQRKRRRSPWAAVEKRRSRARPSVTPSPSPGATAALTVRSRTTAPGVLGAAGRCRANAAPGRCWACGDRRGPGGRTGAGPEPPARPPSAAMASMLLQSCGRRACRLPKALRCPLRPGEAPRGPLACSGPPGLAGRAQGGRAAGGISGLRAWAERPLREGRAAAEPRRSVRRGWRCSRPGPRSAAAAASSHVLPRQRGWRG